MTASSTIIAQSPWSRLCSICLFKFVIITFHYITLLTQSHQVFFGRPLCLIPSTSHFIQLTWNDPHGITPRFIGWMSTTLYHSAMAAPVLSKLQENKYKCVVTGKQWKRSQQTQSLTTLSLRFNGHFPGEPGLANVYWSKGWWRWRWQLDYWSYKLYKAPVISSPTNQHPVFFTGRMPFLSPNQQCQSTEGKISHYMDLLTPSSPTLSLTTNSSWLPWGRVAMPCLSSALWCQYPDCTIMSQWPTFMVGAVNDVHKTRNQQTRKTFHRFYPPANTYHTYIQYLKSTKSATSCQPESGK